MDRVDEGTETIDVLPVRILVLLGLAYKRNRKGYMRETQGALDEDSWRTSTARRAQADGVPRHRTIDCRTDRIVQGLGCAVQYEWQGSCTCCSMRGSSSSSMPPATCT